MATQTGLTAVDFPSFGVAAIRNRPIMIAAHRLTIPVILALLGLLEETLKKNK